MCKLLNEFIERIAQLQPVKLIENMQLLLTSWCDENKKFVYALQTNKLFYPAFLENREKIMELSSLIGKKLGKNIDSYEASYQAGGLINIYHVEL